VGVVDLQLLEAASRIGDKTWLRPLATAIEYDLNHCPRVTLNWLRVHANVDARRPQILDERPLSPETFQFCLGEVGFLPRPVVVATRVGGGVERVVEAREERFETGLASPWGTGTAIPSMSLRDMAEGRRVWGDI
jgi:hypothetical protein